jgi:1,6-anhydro-N-acetylmuramate kinase
MSAFTRRGLIACLAAVASGPALAAQPDGLPALDPAAAKRIGDAYLAAHPATRSVMERGVGSLNPSALRTRVAADFRAGRMFAYRGWRLSQTEARLFALYALTD